MGDTTNPTSGAGGGAPGGAGSNGDSTGSGDNQGNKGGGETVSRADHERVLKDMHRFKTESTELANRLKALETDALTKTNDFKGLYEREKAAREAAEKEKENLRGFMVHNERFNAVKDEATKRGLRPEALKDLELVELDGLPTEVTSKGRIIVDGAASLVAKLQNDRPHWFGAAKPPVVNPGGGASPGVGGDGGKKPPTVQDLVKAEQDMKRGKITKEQFHTVYREYTAATKANATPAVKPDGAGR